MERLKICPFVLLSKKRKAMNRNWKEIRKFEEILFESYNGIAKITINRARYRNAFTPKTTWELSQAFAMCREMQDISVVLLTGAMSEVPEGKTLADVKHAFCSGGGSVAYPSLSSRW